MFCANCGQAIQGEPKFCPACGTPTAAVTDAENKPTASAPVKPKSRFPKWLPLVIGFVALLLIAKMCTPKHPNQSQMDEAAKIVLGQKDPAPSTESVSDVLRRSAETARASIPRKVDEYTTLHGAELIGDKRLRFDFRIDSPNTPMETTNQIRGVMHQQTIAQDCSTADRRRVLDQGGEFEYRYFNADGSHEYGSFVTRASDCSASTSAPTAATTSGANVASNATGLEAALTDMANQINQRAPMRIDSKTVVTGAAATSKTLRMIMNIDHPYPRDQVLAMIESNMPAYVRSNYCSQPSQLKLLKDGAMILMEFRNRDGKEHYATVPVTLDQCG